MNNQDLAIEARNLSKIYRIGLEEEQHDSLLTSLTAFVKSPLKNYRKYRSLYKFEKKDMEAGQDGNSDIIWALRDISFDVRRGEVLGIIGSNGAGKSTLLKILSRITPPTSGSAKIYGRVSSLLEVGTGFHPELTGRENIFLNGTILGMKHNEVKRKFGQIVEFSGIGKFLDTPVKRYSSGMRVRLAFSVAAHLEPEILIVDEVLAVGDAEFQKKCLGKMESVTREGRTVLFVSHNMGAITRLCPNAIHLEKGMVVHSGDSISVVRQYLSSGKATSAERVWEDDEDAPGGEVASLQAVRIKDSSGMTVDNIDIGSPIGLEMRFRVKKDGFLLNPHFHLFNQSGDHIFVTMDLDPRWRGKRRPCGTYTSTAWIPGHLLNEGRLFVTAAMGTLEPRLNQYYVRDAVSFEVIDNLQGDGARGDWTGKIDGIIRPLLKWETEFSKENQPCDL